MTETHARVGRKRTNGRWRRSPEKCERERQNFYIHFKPNLFEKKLKGYEQQPEQQVGISSYAEQIVE